MKFSVLEQILWPKRSPITFLVYICVTILCQNPCISYAYHHVNKPKISGNEVHQREVLDPSGKIIAEWKADIVAKKITFDVTGETTGYIGFGLSKGGGMKDADIVIGGIHPSGNPYFSVRWFISSVFYYIIAQL